MKSVIFVRSRSDVVFTVGIQGCSNQTISLGFESGFGPQKRNHGFDRYFFVQAVSGENQQITILQFQPACFRFADSAAYALIQDVAGIEGGDLFRCDFTFFQQKPGESLILSYLSQLIIMQDL
jgi:hypothetical protein